MAINNCQELEQPCCVLLANFVPKVRWTVMAHMLLSCLYCQLVYKMYQMNISDRNLLLRELKQQFGLQEHQLQIAATSLNIPSAFAAILQDADNTPQKRFNEEQIKKYLISEVGVLYCLHNEDWGSFIDYFDGNLAALKQAAAKISEKV